MKLVKKYLNPNTGSDKLDINGSSNPYADFATKWQQATDRGETSDPMEETRQRILNRLNNNTYYWIDTDGSIKQDYLTDDAAVEDYRRKSGTATPLNWEFNIIAPARFGLGAIGNGIRTGLQAMNTAFTPSTWLNPVTGAKLLSPTVGTIADAGIQGAFAYEGLNGLWNQGRQGTLSSDPGSTVMHGLEVLPLVGLGSKAIGSAYRKFADNPLLKANTSAPVNTTAKRAYSAPKVEAMPVEGEIVTGDVPMITAENAASITPEQWTAAQDAAIVRGDMVEALRLRDLHSNIYGDPIVSYHGQMMPDNMYTQRGLNPYNDKRDYGFYSSSSNDVANTYNFVEDSPTFKLYTHFNKPYVINANKANASKTLTDKTYFQKSKEGYDGVIIKDVYDVGFRKNRLNGASGLADDIIATPGRSKLADAVTYDDNGVRIPLGSRDNFSNPDIRWGLFPWLFGGTIGYNYLNQDNTSSKYTNGGKINKT